MVSKDSSREMKDMDIFNGTSERAVPDFDLIQEIITEYVSPLPGPPRPPPDLTEQMVVQQPKLVPRGTACQPAHFCSQPPLQSHNPREMSHPSRGAGYSRRGPREASCMQSPKTSDCTSSQSHSADTEMLEMCMNKPTLVITEEPKERGMRFRYECEGRSAGSILGASSTETNKTQPAIEIQGSIDHLKKVVVTASLVTKDPPHRPHPHCLVGKDCPNNTGICVVTINPKINRQHSFANLGIQCVRRKELDVSLEKRRNLKIDPFQTGHSKGIEDMDMNSVRLCFQCELEWEDGRKDSLSPVISSPIYDKKATTTSQLKITCLNLYTGSCMGKTEVYMLCDKVQKDDIEIIFRRGPWKANGEFAQTDVHRQIAIVFKTPPYQDQNITEEVEVNVVLRRLSDQMESEPVTFTYLPYNPDPYEVKRKRKIKSDISFKDKPCATAESAPAAEQPFLFPSQTQTMTSPDSRLCAALPGTAPSVDQCFTEPQDSNNDNDASAILNELLENPDLQRILSDPSLTLPMPPHEHMPDVNLLANMDLNFQNYVAYPQDFSHYSDWQFNMLVNENQTPQSNMQDSPDNIQVKMEDEL